jgi:hypothetical protein
MSRGKNPDFNDAGHIERREKRQKQTLEFAGADEFGILIADALRGSAEPLLDYIRLNPLTSQEDRDDLDWFLSRKLLKRKTGRRRNTQQRVRAAEKAAKAVLKMQDAAKIREDQRLKKSETTDFIKKAIKDDRWLDISELGDIEYVRSLLKNKGRLGRKNSARN